MGSPALPRSTFLRILFFSSSSISPFSGHKIIPGATALILTAGASSFARDFVSVSRAPFAPEYRLKFFIPLGAKESEIFITQPLFLVRPS